MTSIQHRTAPVLPTPRAGSPDDDLAVGPPEPRRPARRTRPRQFYWDVITASWRTRGSDGAD
jgi:hypothetical protein